MGWDWIARNDAGQDGMGWKGSGKEVLDGVGVGGGAFPPREKKSR